MSAFGSARTSSGGPATATRPNSITTTDEHSEKTSGTSCSTSTIVVSATWWMRWSSGMKASASRWAMPAVGSSSSSSLGLASTMEARSTTRRVPVESSAVRWSWKRPSPKASMTWSTASRLARSARRAQGSCRVVESTDTSRFASSQSISTSYDRQLGVEPAVLERTDHADPRPLLGHVLRQVDPVELHRALVRGGPVPRSCRAWSSCPTRWPRSGRRWHPAPR